MNSMTPAVRRALGLAPKLPKRTQNIPKNIPVPSPVVKESLTTPAQNYDTVVSVQEKGEMAGFVQPKAEKAKNVQPDHFADTSKMVLATDGLRKSPKNAPGLTVFEELYHGLTSEHAVKSASLNQISPAYCPRPDDLCQGCGLAGRCG